MIITMKKLTVDGVTLPTPALEGVTHSHNKMWSANTGRLESTGEMVGTIVAVKEKFEIKWPDLTPAQAQLIENATAGTTAFHTMEYADYQWTNHSLTVYFGDFTYDLVDNRTGGRTVRNAKISAIEK